MQDPITEPALAKINLTLRVLGRRRDGYHELVSLVAFAGIGDELHLHPGQPFALEATGPFASAIEAANLIERACETVLAGAPDAVLGRFELVKRLPVAAGLGGGSADAAAALRCILRANPGLAPRIDLAAIAARLGADVSVCLASRAALMWGIGERVRPLPSLPEAHVVLVNPGVPLATADVFRALSAPPLAATPPEPPTPGPFAGARELAAACAASGNDLAHPARRLCPVIGEVETLTGMARGCLHAAQSGSGPTCFGLFATSAAARAAHAAIAAARPGWWSVAARLQ
jgi:4-diphosphocytidyl-2-C-methyl-D-erythritol kinase